MNIYLHSPINLTTRFFGGDCNCVAGKGEACSHVAALLFYLDDLTSCAITTLPTDTTVTGRPQQWHKPPKRNVDPKPLLRIHTKRQERRHVSKSRKRQLHQTAVLWRHSSKPFKHLTQQVDSPNFGLPHHQNSLQTLINLW